ncbi:hypothetical protein CRUP_015340 [Coryphaenoides rupestris]|nr:hypothetical protein CRUP_015340 [Coryphaenoides rupestris]
MAWGRLAICVCLVIVVPSLHRDRQVVVARWSRCLDGEEVQDAADNSGWMCYAGNKIKTTRNTAGSVTTSDILHLWNRRRGGRKTPREDNRRKRKHPTVKLHNVLEVESRRASAPRPHCGVNKMAAAASPPPRARPAKARETLPPGPPPAGSVIPRSRR